MPLRLAGSWLLLATVYCWGPAVWAGSSNSLMDVSPDGTRLLVANPDNGTVTVVDTAAHKALREIQVGEKPEGVTWIGNGPLAAVTVYRDDQVVFFDAHAGQIVQKLAVTVEPYGIVASQDGRRAWVTHEYPSLVSEIDVRAHQVLRTFPVGTFLRGLALSPDESRLYVTEYYTGVLHAVDLKTGSVVDSWKG